VKTNIPSSGQALSHNQLGQRIGRKGRDTRGRIIAAAERLLADRTGPPITLSAVAREASLGMTSLYSYFKDLSELVGAVLEPAMALSEEAYVAQVRTFWPDETLGEHCRRFVESYHRFWCDHAGVLHLRNAMSDQGDERMLVFRQTNIGPLFNLLLMQIEARDKSVLSVETGIVTALVTGLERLITVLTHPNYAEMTQRSGALLEDEDRAIQVQAALNGQAWLLETAILRARRRFRGG
jgi:AcrR family transcriptional regulator